MDKIKDWLLSLPPLMLGSIAVLGGILFMFMADPPKTVCDSQFETYRKNLEVRTPKMDFAIKSADQAYTVRSYIFPSKVSPELEMPPLIQSQYESCLKSNSPGGCYDYIRGLKDWWRELKIISSQCGSEFGKIKPSKDWMVRSIKTFVEIAWGELPPETFKKKSGWLERSDLIVYCGIKREFVRFFGSQEWTKLREEIIQKLPGAQKMDRVDLWEKSILSIACEKIINLPE